MIRTKYKIGREVQFPNGDALQVAYGTGSRVTLTASGASTAEAALPTGARLLFVRATDAVWIRFGDTGVGAAAANDDSILFPAGEAAVPVPLNASGDPFTFVRVLRVGAEDCLVQFESIAHVDGV